LNNLIINTQIGKVHVIINSSVSIINKLYCRPASVSI